MYRFLLKPRWIVSHVLIGTLIFTMAGAAVWQWTRYNEEKAGEERLDARLAAAPVPLPDLVSVDDPYDVGDDLAGTRVVIEGTYLPEDEVTVRNRSLEGVPGSWVLTPLLTETGVAVVVNRGWTDKTAATVTPATAEAESAGSAGDAGDVAPPDGSVEVIGVLQPTSTRRGFFSPSDPAGGVLSDMARPDLARIEQQLDVEIYPVVVQLQEQQPGQPGAEPIPVPVDEPTPGQNLGYAGQWLIFTTIAVLGYPLILHRVAHSRRSPDVDLTGEDEPERTTQATAQMGSS
ncbi:MAG: hypothetical protein JJLCMIEE_02231 [Acidimicrobiales bacterium]|nr:MAG: SURF1 family protein [Actinomycetota bacterium]MBV6509163.1 hypothetical protein [Acidimicrobiales bacterium]RIK08490.1 MAG: hypothetical protein DCC48_00635 [Acidobacteriota bacterium]